MAPVKTERYQNNGALSSPVDAYSCAWTLLSLGVYAMDLAFHHTVTEGQAVLPKLNFRLLTLKALYLFLRQSVPTEEWWKRMSFRDCKKFFLPCLHLALHVHVCACIYMYVFRYVNIWGGGEGGKNNFLKMITRENTMNSWFRDKTIHSPLPSLCWLLMYFLCRTVTWFHLKSPKSGVVMGRED